ncbi:MAG: phage tail tape measure protein [Treponema sp.]|jgi:hypothetical protein|nr:phage tail tape measure protein [Treponema sp.]
MPGQLQTAVELSLKDKFSSGIKSAGNSVSGFKDKAINAAYAIDQAFSSVGARLASLGVTIGAAALIKSSVEYEDSIIRIGTNAGMSGAEVNQFRRDLLAIATEAKVPIQELVKFSQAVTDNAIGLDVASESARFMADAMQGLGLSGQETGEILSVLVHKGADIDTVKQKLNNLAEIDDRLQGMGLAQFARVLPELMEASDAAVGNIEDLYISILTLNNGATNKQALTQYKAAMQDFASPETRNAMRKYMKGFDTKDQNGELKSFTEIMAALVEKGKEAGGFDQFQKAFHFSDNTLKALKQFNKYSAETIEKVSSLGDTSTAVSGQAEQNAKSLASNLVSLQNNILKLSDAVLTKPIASLAKLLDEHPQGMELAIKGVGAALLALSAMKAFSTVVTFMANIKGLKGGNIGTGLTGGAGIPVHVTNAGGLGAGGQFQQPQALNPQLSNNPLTAAQTAVGNITPKQYAGAAGGAAIAAAFVKIPQMINELDAIKQNEELTAKERGRAKGGAVGDATGSIVGAAAGGAAGIAAGAAVGAAVGSVVPVLGTAVGALVGAGIGALGMYLGGKAGRKIGEGIGESLADDGPGQEQQAKQSAGYNWGGGEIAARQQAYKKMAAVDLPPQITRATPGLAPQKIELGGQAVMDVNVNLSGSTPTASVTVRDNTTDFRFNTGSRVSQRRGGM